MKKNSTGEYRLYASFPKLTIGVAAKSANPVDYSAASDDIRSAEKKILSTITGIDDGRILGLNQLHEDRIIIIRELPRSGGAVFGDADGLMTDLPGLCLVIRTADCVPVFAYDPVRHVIGAAHSGWRGTRLAIARTMIRRMKEEYRSHSEDIRAFILPSIGPDAYTVGKDVAELFPRDITEQNGLIHLSLWQNIERSLREEGLTGENIFNTRRCTRSMNNEFFSHRAGDRGRNLNFAFLS